MKREIPANRSLKQETTADFIELQKLIEKFYNDNNPDDENGLFADEHNDRFMKMHDGLTIPEALDWTNELASEILSDDQFFAYKQVMMNFVETSKASYLMTKAEDRIDAELFQTEKFTRFIKCSSRIDIRLKFAVDPAMFQKKSLKELATSITIKLHELIEKFWNDNNPDDRNGLFADTHENRFMRIHDGLTIDEAFAWTKRLERSVGRNEQHLYFDQSIIALCHHAKNDEIVKYLVMSMDVPEEEYRTERFARFLKEDVDIDTALKPEPKEEQETVPTLSVT